MSYEVPINIVLFFAQLLKTVVLLLAMVIYMPSLYDFVQIASSLCLCEAEYTAVMHAEKV